MQIKLEVNQSKTSPAIWYALGAAEVIHLRMFGKPITVTSMNDGEHMNGSLHYQGLAADLRTHDIRAEERALFRTQLLKALFSLGFDVLDEQTHIHIEYDPKNKRQLFNTLATGQ